MAGARKTKYHDFHVGGQGEVGHGSKTGGVGPHTPNQVTPGHHPVNRCPEDEGSFDENFAQPSKENAD
jgi:hypothetical protein